MNVHLKDTSEKPYKCKLTTAPGFVHKKGNEKENEKHDERSMATRKETIKLLDG